MVHYIDKDALVAEIERRIKTNKECMLGLRNLDYYQGKVDALKDTLFSLNTLEVKEVDLEKEYKDFVEEDPVYNKLVNGIVGKAIAKHFFELCLKAQHDNWKVENLWKPADGDDLPEIDREIIALLDNGKVVFAHRPPEYWDGKNIITGEVTRNYPKTYDKGGWNIPDVKWWLDCLLPNMKEE